MKVGENGKKRLEESKDGGVSGKEADSASRKHASPKDEGQEG